MAAGKNLIFAVNYIYFKKGVCDAKKVFCN